jgi:hypothetical protein
MSVFHLMGNGWQVHLLIILSSYGMELKGNLLLPSAMFGMFTSSGKQNKSFHRYLNLNAKDHLEL